MPLQIYTPEEGKILHRIKVDLANKNYDLNNIVLTQYDETLPLIVVDVYNNGDSFTINPDLHQCKLIWTRPDGSAANIDALGVSSDYHTLYFAVSKQLTFFHGDLKLVLDILEQSQNQNDEPEVLNRVASSYINIKIKRNPVQEGTIAKQLAGLLANVAYSGNYSDLLNKLIAGAGITISNNVISATTGLHLEVVDELPEEGDAQTIYLVKKASTESSDLCDEYVWVYDPDTEAYRWEFMGSSHIDTDSFVKKDSVTKSFAMMNLGFNATTNKYVISTLTGHTFTSYSLIFEAENQPYFQLEYYGTDSYYNACKIWMEMTVGNNNLPLYNMEHPKYEYLMFIAPKDEGSIIKQGDYVITKIQYNVHSEASSLRFYIIAVIPPLKRDEIGIGQFKINIDEWSGLVLRDITGTERARMAGTANPTIAFSTYLYPKTAGLYGLGAATLPWGQVYANTIGWSEKVGSTWVGHYFETKDIVVQNKLSAQNVWSGFQSGLKISIIKQGPIYTVHIYGKFDVNIVGLETKLFEIPLFSMTDEHMHAVSACGRIGSTYNAILWITKNGEIYTNSNFTASEENPQDIDLLITAMADNDPGYISGPGGHGAPQNG